MRPEFSAPLHAHVIIVLSLNSPSLSPFISLFMSHRVSRPKLPGEVSLRMRQRPSQPCPSCFYTRRHYTHGYRWTYSVSSMWVSWPTVEIWWRRFRSGAYIVAVHSKTALLDDPGQQSPSLLLCWNCLEKIWTYPVLARIRLRYWSSLVDASALRKIMF